MNSAEIPRHQQLDIVNDCSDLAGTFPDNVELKFIYWAHGILKEDGNYTAADPVNELIPHLLDADMIGFEVPYIKNVNDPEVFVENEFIAINDVCKTNIPYEDWYSKHKETRLSGHFGNAMRIRNGLDLVGNSNPTHYVPLDIFAESLHLEPLVNQWLQGGVVNYELNMARLNRHREAVVLRQLHHYATELAQDGQSHQIATIFGKYHSLMSVGARALGAATARAFISMPEINFNTAFGRKIRFIDDSNEREQEIKVADQAIIMARHILLTCGELGVELPSIKSEADKRRFQSSLEWMTYNWLQGSLDTTQGLIVKETMQKFEPYRQKSLPHFRSKQKLRLAGRQLLTMVEPSVTAV